MMIKIIIKCSDFLRNMNSSLTINQVSNQETPTSISYYVLLIKFINRSMTVTSKKWESTLEVETKWYISNLLNAITILHWFSKRFDYWFNETKWLTFPWPGHYHVETSLLICKANQSIGFYMIKNSLLKVLRFFNRKQNLILTLKDKLKRWFSVKKLTKLIIIYTISIKT